MQLPATPKQHDLISGILIQEIEKLPAGETEAEEESEQQSQTQTPNDSSLFAAFFRQRGGFVSDRIITAEQEVAKLFSFSSKKCHPLLYWYTEKTLPKLRQLALRSLTIPATSAPIERVFSCSGFVMRPKRSTLSAAMLEKIIFLRCNE